MIVVLMTSRSGSSMVCRALAEHGLRWRDHKRAAPKQDPKGGRQGYPTYESPTIKKTLKRMCPNERWPLGDMLKPTSKMVDELDFEMQEQEIDFVKSGIEFAELWKAWGAATGRLVRFIKVWRPPEDIAESLHERFGNDWLEAFRIADKRYRLMDGIQGHLVVTPLMAQGQWTRSGLKKAIEANGIKFDEQAAQRAVATGQFGIGIGALKAGRS